MYGHPKKRGALMKRRETYSQTGPEPQEYSF